MKTFIHSATHYKYGIGDANHHAKNQRRFGLLRLKSSMLDETDL